MSEATEVRVLDRKVNFDARSRAFSVATATPHTKIRSYSWACTTWNDQGQEGACVGFAWSHELSARPVVIPTDNVAARAIYATAKTLDPWVGEDYEGTSVLAGVKAARDLYKDKKGAPVIAEYRWAFSLEDLVRSLGYRGPAVLGINWYTGMYNVDSTGFIHKNGWLAGGHAILARSVRIVWKDVKVAKTWDNVDLTLSYVILRNSWGKLWGTNGDCKISLSDLDVLLGEQGEVCIPVIRKK